ncbi:hypothetical protein [Flavilitoribacter nigricans]|uniref:Uncharacterized protein n=1 Tax=Flavilitoribacter nigricans (strain ATCC 23147 / DSM 23189 / NBRC 102662 / NCIMB 1420 / SS-2) TaxID=1122177 RepID=A0A2D0N6E4_FLAN2|nr:hypothetical protein [Flavilitoribacter nigricans]PHN03729.1 hypothetical protein CRP01_24555 [Flavilitoribacter nigricans DSM 23189 = NBRC 102662]
MNIKDGNFNGNSNFNNSKSGEKVKIGVESCLLLAIAIVLDIVIEKFPLRVFIELKSPALTVGFLGYFGLFLTNYVTKSYLFGLYPKKERII